MSEPIQTDADLNPEFDPHRFTAEPRRKPSKLLVTVIMVFVATMTVVGAAVMIGKNRFAASMAERDKAKALEKEQKKADEANQRKGKVFDQAPKTAAAALPGGFNSAKPTPPPANEAAIPVVVNGNKSATAAPVSNTGTSQPRPRPAMMLGDSDANAATLNSASPGGVQAGALPGAAGANGGNGANGANAAAPLLAGSGQSAPRARDVQEHAAQMAQKAPLTATAQATAANLGNRSYLLARGAFIPCVLETQLISNIAGNSSCLLPQNIYSDDGKVLLLEKGSRIVGQYQSNVKAGDTRLAILWQRIKTPQGVVIDVDSPATDGVGSTGAPGFVDNHWPERIGAAFLLSLLDDVVRIEIAKHNEGAVNNTTTPTATAGATKSMAEKVLDSTINIPPTLYKNRGDRLMVYVNRDLWFDSVYKVTQR